MEVLSYYDKGRISNIIWTITSKYGYEVDFSLIKESYFSYDLIYNATIIGSLYNVLDYNMIEKFIKNIRGNINEDKEVLTIFFICIEETCINKNIEYIENIANLREQNYKSSIKNMSSLKEKDRLYNSIRLAYWFKNTGNSMLFPKNIISLINIMSEFRHVNDTSAFIEKFKSVIDLYFKFEDKISSQNHDGITKLSSKVKSKNNKEKIYEFFEEYTSSEFNPNESVIDINFSSDSSTIHDKDEMSEEEKNIMKMEKYYGKSMYSIDKTRSIEKKYCKDIHSQYKLFFTRGDLSSITEEYRRKQLELEKEENIYEYTKNKNYYNQVIDKLKFVIRQSIIQSENKNNNKSYSGNIQARDVYRVEKINDYRIFIKKKNKDEIKLSVNIVIDSSASLLKKQNKLAVQAYIISKALEELGISNSVQTFNSFMDYTIIKTLKDYKENKSENCFNYFCSSGNRDGLAIDVIGSTMIEEMYDYKNILIIFTDAKPFDVQVMYSIGSKAKKAYHGNVAIDDTSFVIRKLRRNGVKLCGIFSGEEEDIDTIRYMYGRDFLHINSIEQFADKVGKYISDYIISLYDWI